MTLRCNAVTQHWIIVVTVNGTWLTDFLSNAVKLPLSIPRYNTGILLALWLKWTCPCSKRKKTWFLKEDLFAYRNPYVIYKGKLEAEVKASIHVGKVRRRSTVRACFTSYSQFRQWIVDNLTIIRSWSVYEKFKGRISKLLPHRCRTSVIQLFHLRAHEYNRSANQIEFLYSYPFAKTRIPLHLAV